MGVLALVLMGIVAHGYLKVDRLPPLSYPTITVTTRYPQAAALDVEQLVTEIIEDAVAGAEGIDSISSTSREGRSTVRVQLVEGADPDMASLEIKRRISRIRSRLPVDAIDPTIAKADPNELPSSTSPLRARHSTRSMTSRSRRSSPRCSLSSASRVSRRPVGSSASGRSGSTMAVLPGTTCRSNSSPPRSSRPT